MRYSDDYHDDRDDAERYQLDITPYYIIAYRADNPRGLNALYAFCFLLGDALRDASVNDWLAVIAS